MKIGFYITNKNFCKIDCSNLQNGNPGIGGTYYAMLQVVYALSELSDDYYLLMDADMSVPSHVKKVVLDRSSSPSNDIKRLQLDYIVVNKIGPGTLPPQFFDSIRATGVKVIVWVHCSIGLTVMNYFAKEPIIDKVVAVSRIQYYTWFDHELFRKATYIYNVFDMINPYPITEYSKRKNTVVYLGAINHVKGVHYITKAWNKVKRSIPDAELLIIGSGKLYSSSMQCGKFDIAEKYYERKLLKPILQNGMIDPSVKFLGVMGKEKWEIMNRAKVGITNAGSWETFGYTMLEMQLAGMQVTSFKSPGLIDTMCPNGGVLYDNPSKLADILISLLRNNDYDFEKSIEYSKSTFSNSRIIPEWRKLFNNELHVGTDEISELSKELTILKYIKFNKSIKKYLPFLPPFIYYRDKLLNVKRILTIIADPHKLMGKLTQSI